MAKATIPWFLEANPVVCGDDVKFHAVEITAIT